VITKKYVKMVRKHFLRLKNMWRGGYAGEHVKPESKQTKIRVFWVMASCTLEQVCVHMSSAYVRRLDHAYAYPYLETLIHTETKQKLKT